ncbi:potassium channel family protein [Salinarchaeum laminariae]|uniref:potassium channel family protein n=1 Tax=Salinarchaeum laminariae TaxID=869888 RepID=UPI0020BF4DAF|nr:NAD-binding protein [Salinarchaeum laminariae]
MRSLTDVKGLRPRDLTRRQRLLVLFGIGIVLLVSLFTTLYYVGMRTVEDRPRDLFHSLNIVVETMTTTGFGSDSPWKSPWMNALIITMQATGVLMGFITLRVLVIPLFERTPLNLDDRLTPKRDHVVIAEYERDSEVLLDELEELGIDYVLLESEEAEAKQLSDDGYQAINGNPEERGDLERATIGEAALLITDAGDRTASVVLTALELNEELRVVSFTESTRRKAALAEVGVDRSVAPHALIGQRLAEKATTPVALGRGTGGGSDTGADATEGPTDGVGIREILIRRDSPLHGVRIGDSPLANHPDLTLVAGWLDGHLQVPPAPTSRLTPNAVLVVAGPENEIDELVGEVSAVRSPMDRVHPRVIVAGLGEGGRAAVDVLPEEVAVTTVDQTAERKPDVVGDVTEPDVLESAGIEDASALVVTVDDDATALLTIAMARALSTDVEILARVTESEKAAAAFRAGADYVLSIQRVSARLVAAEVHGERVVDFASQIRVVRVDGAPFHGERLGDLRGVEDGPDGADDSNWTVVGLVRDGEVRTDEGETVREGEEVIVAGSDEAIQTFERTMG